MTLGFQLSIDEEDRGTVDWPFPRSTLPSIIYYAEPIIIIFLGSDKCQARCESSLTFVDYGLTLWHAAIMAQN